MHSPPHALKSLYVYESPVSDALWIFALALSLAVILIPLYSIKKDPPRMGILLYGRSPGSLSVSLLLDTGPV